MIAATVGGRPVTPCNAMKRQAVRPRQRGPPIQAESPRDHPTNPRETTTMFNEFDEETEAENVVFLAPETAAPRLLVRVRYLDKVEIVLPVSLDEADNLIEGWAEAIASRDPDDPRALSRGEIVRRFRNDQYADRKNLPTIVAAVLWMMATGENGDVIRAAIAASEGTIVYTMTDENGELRSRGELLL